MRASSQVGLAAYASYQLAWFGQPLGTLSTMRQVAARLSGKRTPSAAGNCFPSAITGTAYNWTASSTATSNTEKYDAFYDTSCNQPALTETITYPNPPNGTASGSYIAYDRSGNVIGYAPLQLSATQTASAGSLTVAAQVSRTQGGPVIRQTGMTCSFTLNPNTANCNLGLVAPAAPTPYGASLQISTGSGGTSTSSFTTYNANVVLGGTPVLSQGNGTWTVSGGSTSYNTGGSVSLVYNGSFVTGGNFHVLADASFGVQVDGSVTGTAIAGTVDLNNNFSNQIGHFTTDANGFGTMTYSDNSTEPIVAYALFG